MYPQTHFLFSLLIALIFTKFGIFDYQTAFFIAIFAVLMDIDHFINFVIRKNDYSLKDAWNTCVKGHFHGRTFIHHKIGFILITLIIVALYYFNRTWFWIVGLGYYTHMFIDYAHLNILKIREKMIIKGQGFVTKINKFEVLLDIFLLIGIILLII